MKFRFIGKYTNGHTSVFSNGVTFFGREPSEAEGEAALRLARHPEFVEVHPLDHDGDGEKGGSLPKKRGRPRKVVD